MEVSQDLLLYLLGLLTVQRAAILALFHAHGGELTVQQLADSGLYEGDRLRRTRSASKYLERLSREGLVEKVGGRPMARYRLTKVGMELAAIVYKLLPEVRPIPSYEED